MQQHTLQYWQCCQPFSVVGSCELLLHKGLSVSGSVPLKCKHKDTNFNIFIHSFIHPFLTYYFIIHYFKMRWVKHTCLLSIFSTCYIKDTCSSFQATQFTEFNPLNTELNPICYLLALLGAHHFLHISRIRVKSLILRLLMLYIYIYIYIYIRSTYSWCF